MHKSAITNSLFLMMGALIILVPFTSITLPNVKAQEQSNYNDDDDGYSTYLTDDKKLKVNNLGNMLKKMNQINYIEIIFHTDYGLIDFI